jgi:hypothetical protein
VTPPQNAASPSDQELLRQLEEASCPAAPRFHGIYALAREVLNFVEGHVSLTAAEARQVAT